MSALVARIERDIAPIEVAVFNIGANVRFAVTETTERVYRKVWEMGALAGFLMGREVAQVMLAARPRHDHLHRRDREPARLGRLRRLRRRQARAARAGAEHGARAGAARASTSRTSSSTARSTPQFIAENFPERYALKDKDGILNPDAIADTYWKLHQQQRSAWTHELDLRPWIEKF